MASKIGNGVLAGLLAGLVFGLLMQIMTAPTPEGERVPVITMVAMILGSQSAFVGWLYHLFNSAVIGALFGALLGGRVRGAAEGLAWGALYGLAWWVLGGLFLMPLFLGMPVFQPARAVALGSLAGHLVYGLILGATYEAFRRQPAPEPAPVGRERPRTHTYIGSE